MNPLRLVCESCLQSVELAPDSEGCWPTACPVCRQPLDSQLSEVSTPETRAPKGSPTVDRDRGKGPVGRPSGGWSAVWERGSYGTFARFQLQEELGRGAFGVVYKAIDPRLGRLVALKVLEKRDPGERVKERFYREARAAARLDHPNIAQVHDSGCEDGYCWVAYQHIPGPTLHRWLAQQGRPELAASVRIVAELARALEHSHGRGVFHRDLKPSNAIIEKGKGKAVLIDFGLSRFEDVDSNLTHDNAVVGTPQYMAPEQWKGRSKEADARSDIYSLGVIFYEMLCGQNPSGQPSGARPWQAGDPVPPTIMPPRTLNPTIPAALEAACLKALAVQPADRYAHAGLFAAELEGWLAARQRTGRPSPLATNAVMAIGGALLLAVALMFTLAPNVGGSIKAPDVRTAQLLATPGSPGADSPATAPAPTATTASSPVGPSASVAQKSTAGASLAPAAPAASGVAMHYYRTASGERYHLFTDCSHMNSNAHEIEAAEAAGLKLCQSCGRRAEKDLQNRAAAMRPR